MDNLKALNKEILVTIPVNEAHKKYLEEKASSGKYSCVFRYIPGKEVTKEDVNRANVIIGNLPPTLVQGAEKLEWYQLNSAGADQYTKPGILPEDCVLTNATGAYGLAVSEHMLALTFDLIRRLNQYHRNQAEHLWQWKGNPMGSIISVEGSTVLIMGMGDIGGDYAKKVKALGAYTIGIRRTNKNKPEYLDEQYTLDEIDNLLPRADIVAMVLPGGEATHHLMDERRLRLMKKGSYLINVGRGNAIDPKALLTVMQEGHLGGCGLDVTEPEPLPADDPLWACGNVVITPHVAGNFFLQETFERIVRIAGTNMEAWATDGEFTTIVDFATGYKK